MTVEELSDLFELGLVQYEPKLFEEESFEIVEYCLEMEYVSALDNILSKSSKDEHKDVVAYMCPCGDEVIEVLIKYNHTIGGLDFLLTRLYHEIGYFIDIVIEAMSPQEISDYYEFYVVSSTSKCVNAVCYTEEWESTLMCMADV
ncbi:hypothetical protein OAF54_03535 [bacterium]|nr:hypothetical protein [bacterium]